MTLFLTKIFRKLDHVNNPLNGDELAEAQIEHTNPIVLGFMILQNAKLWNLEFYQSFFTKLCDLNKIELSNWMQIRCVLLFPRGIWIHSDINNLTSDTLEYSEMVNQL